MPLRTPTPLKSTDLQCGHRVESKAFFLIPSHRFSRRFPCRGPGRYPGTTASIFRHWHRCRGSGPAGWPRALP